MSNVLRFKETGDKSYLRRFYDSKKYARVHAVVSPRLATKFRVIIEEMQPLVNQKMLDVGCASSHLERYVIEQGGTYAGVDIAMGLASDAVIDAEDLCFASDSFD